MSHRGWNALSGEWQVMNLRGNTKAPKHAQRFIDAKAGSPKRRETHGDGTPILPGDATMRPHPWEGAAHENGPERLADTKTQGRYQEVSKGRGMRNAND
jgi:hypothetical protein